MNASKKSPSLANAIALLRAIFAGLLRTIMSWNSVRLIGTYLVVLLTTKKAYIQGKRLFSNDVSMEGFWSLKEHFNRTEKWDWMENPK
jgi:hypothetical protein